MGTRILVVEDDYSTSRLVTMALNSAGHAAEAAASCAEARELISSEAFDLVLCDLYLGDGTGLELLKERSANAPEPLTPFVMFTAQGSVETAVEAIKEGAFDYLAKPFKIEDLIHLVEKALTSVRSNRIKSRQTPDEEKTMLVGNSPPMVELYKRIALAAQSDSSVMITGETGTGKELVARSLHDFSPRRAGQFVAINCGALTETLLESELFGHERGAFTGAITSRKGLFEQAAGGTLFLDEVSETTPAFQVKLLRALQEGEIRPVGSTRTIRTNARIVAASNQDLIQAMEAKTFRKDLYYRLGVVHLMIPPLRERSEDIPQLARYFLKRVSRQLSREISLTDAAVKLLRVYSWPGNVRELENVIERVAVLKTDSILTEEDFEFLTPERPEFNGKHLTELNLVEREKIIEVLKETRGNRAETSRRLGIERKSLYRKAKRLGIDLTEFAS